MRTVLTAATVVALTLILNSTGTAQVPANQSPGVTRAGRAQRDVASSPDAKLATDVVTLSGCVRDEKDVEGQHPSVAERVGVDKDYLLTNAKIAAAANSSGAKIPSTFKVTGAAASELKNHVGHQVEVVGRFTNATARDIYHPQGISGATPGATGSSTTRESGGSTTGGVTTSSPANARSKTATTAGRGSTHVSANEDLPRIEASSIKMVASTCSVQ